MYADPNATNLLRWESLDWSRGSTIRLPGHLDSDLSLHDVAAHPTRPIVAIPLRMTGADEDEDEEQPYGVALINTETERVRAIQSPRANHIDLIHFSPDGGLAVISTFEGLTLDETDRDSHQVWIVDLDTLSYTLHANSGCSLVSYGWPSWSAWPIGLFSGYKTVGSQQVGLTKLVMITPDDLITLWSPHRGFPDN